MKTRNFSLTIWLSVSRKVTGMPRAPALAYSASRFSLNSGTPYVEDTEIWNT